MSYRLPEKGGTEFIVLESDIRGWQRIYTEISVEIEIEKMRQWLIANPRSRKENTRRFVINWLAKAEGTKPKSSASSYRDSVQRAHREEMAKPVASPEVARRALDEAMAMLGIR